MLFLEQEMINTMSVSVLSSITRNAEQLVGLNNKFMHTFGERNQMFR
jgi:hypothetical protein